MHPPRGLLGRWIRGAVRPGRELMEEAAAFDTWLWLEARCLLHQQEHTTVYGLLFCLKTGKG